MNFDSKPAALVELRKQFDQHRGIGKRAVFPDELKRQTVALLDDYSPGAILQALRISPTSLSRWKKQALDSNPTSSQTFLKNDTNTFISLPASDPGASIKLPLTVVLGCAGSDEKITLNGQITLKQWQEVLVSITKVLLP